MALIKNIGEYPIDGNVSLNDFLIGTNSDAAGTTLNYRIGDITGLMLNNLGLVYGNILLSGGAVWLEGLTFNVSALTYILNNKIYYADGTDITLGTADATNPRIDLIVVDANGVISVVAGTPSPTPVATSIALLNVVEVTNITISALATIPDGAIDDLIYDELTGAPTEWTATEDTGDTRIKLNYGVSAHSGTKSIFVQAGVLGGTATFISDSSHLFSDFDNIHFYMKSETTWTTSSHMIITLYDGVTIVTNSIELYDGINGINSTDSTYHGVNIPMSNFSTEGTSFDKMTIEFVETENLYIDSIRIVGGTNFAPELGTLLSLIDVDENNYTGKANYVLSVKADESGTELIPFVAGVTDHTLLTNIGTNTHVQIDTHIADSTLHFTQASINITASQVSDFDTEVSNNSSVVLNTAKITNFNHTGDATGDTVLTISNNVVTNAKLFDMSQNTIKGQITAALGTPEDLTATQVRTIINVEDGATADQTTIVGIGGAKVEYNASLSDGDFLFLGDPPTSHTLGSHSDYTEFLPVDGHIITYNLGSWGNRTLASAGISEIGHTHVEADITDLQPYLLSSDIDTFVKLDAIVVDKSLVNLEDGGTFSSDIIVPDESYAIGWNGDLSVPTKNAVYDKMETKADIIAYNALSTGLADGGLLSINVSTTTYDVTAGSGIIIDNVTDPNNPVLTEVTWTAKTNISPVNILTTPVSFICIDINGDILEDTSFPTPTQRRSTIFLGATAHSNNVNINATVNYPTVAIDVGAQLQDIIRFIGFQNITGNIIGAAATDLTILKTAGLVFVGGGNFQTLSTQPHEYNIDLQNPVTFRYKNQDGSEGIATTLIDPTTWDDGGVTTVIGGSVNSSTIQRFFMFPNGNVRVYRGQSVFSSFSAALAIQGTEQFILDEPTRENALFLGSVVLRRNATDLSDDTQAYFVTPLGITSSTSITSTLQSAYDVSTIPQILTDASGGALTIKRGSVLDTDNVFNIQNGVGTITSFFTGEGNLTANSFIKIGGVSTEFLKADGTVDTNTYLTSYTETDPIFIASQAFNIDAGDITNLGNLSGTNTGDQTTIVGISGTKAQYDTSVTDGDFLYVGDTPKNDISSKKWVIFGDSQVNSLAGDYPKNVIDILGLTGTVTNAVAGDTVQDQLADLDTLLAGDANYFDAFDIVSLHIGVNSFAGSVELGYSTDTSASANFAGYLMDFIETVLSASKPTIKFYISTPTELDTVFLPYREPNGAGYTLEQLAQLMSQICVKYGVQCIDLYSLVQMNLETFSAFSGDNLHITTTEGKEYVGQIVANAFINQNSKGNTYPSNDKVRALTISQGVNSIPTKLEIENVDTTLLAGEELGRIDFITNDASSGNGVAGSIRSYLVDGGFNYGLKFYTKHTTAEALAMDINQLGWVTIQRASNVPKLIIERTGSAPSQIEIHTTSLAAVFDYIGGSNGIKFQIESADKMTISESGNVDVVGDIAANNLSGNNTGDQTSIVGITGAKAQFDTAVTDDNFAYQSDLHTKPVLSKSFWIPDPISTDDIGLFVSDTAITLTKMETYIVGGTSVTFNISHNTNPTTTTDWFTADKVANTTATVQSHSTGVSDATVADGEVVKYMASAVSGAVTGLHVTIFYTED